jgi:hypothetical protein
LIPYIDTTLAGSLVITVFIAGSASGLMGQALAATWRPLWQLFIYGAMLGLADRFLNFALFEGRLLSPIGYIVDTAMIVVVALIAYRVTLARMMVRQYPWLYAKVGLFGWREIGGRS